MAKKRKKSKAKKTKRTKRASPARKKKMKMKKSARKTKARKVKARKKATVKKPEVTAPPVNEPTESTPPQTLLPACSATKRLKISSVSASLDLSPLARGQAPAASRCRTTLRSSLRKRCAGMSGWITAPWRAALANLNGLGGVQPDCIDRTGRIACRPRDCWP